MNTLNDVVKLHNDLVIEYNIMRKTLPDGDIRGNHETIVKITEAYSRYQTIGEVIDKLKVIIDNHRSNK